jgi:hypothetical protein
VKVHVFVAARPVPAAFSAPVEIVAVNIVFGASPLDGSSVAVVPA